VARAGEADWRGSTEETAIVAGQMSQDGQDHHDPQNIAWSIVSYLLSGILVWGGVGWLLDRWIGSGAVFTVIGILGGCGLGIYLGYMRFTRL
jgi:ATP synthase protein I